ncbi:hypothetical protein ACPA9J_22035 [Pseudomonas aeruginosa]
MTPWPGREPAIVLGILFEAEHRLHGRLAFSIAAFQLPVLLLSMYWKKLTTPRRHDRRWIGLITAVGLMVLGPTIWVQILEATRKPSTRTVPGAVLDDRRLRRYLVLLHHRQVGGSRRAGALLPASSSVPRPAWAPLARWPTKRYVKT